MTDKYTGVEERDIFLNVFGSPAKSDTSSLDIYDGLDVASLSDELPQSSTPPRNCLDLYEEIITEEVTAKEASHSDLQSAYDKCQKQMKALIEKLKEIQMKNTSLQNENICLKKNISALIKTARVEINRKDQEINNLERRLSTPRSFRNFKSVPPHKTHCQGDMPYRDVRSMNVGNMRTEVKVQSTSSEATVSGNSDKNAPEKGNISGLVESGTLITSKYQNAMHNKDSLDSLQKEVTKSHLNAGEKKQRKEKDRDLRGRKEERQQITNLENEKRNFDLRGKLNLSDKIAPEKRNISGLVEIGTLITTKCQNVMHHKESLDSSFQKEVPESHLNAGEKKPRKEKDTDNRDRDLRGRKEERQQITSLENEKRNFDLRGKLNLFDKIAPEKGNISGPVESGTFITTKFQNVMHHKECLDSSLQKEVSESQLNAGEQKPRKEKDTDNKDRDLRGRKEERQQITNLENEKRNFDLRGKLNLSDKIAPEKGNISGLVETGTLITTKCQNVMHHKESLDSSLQKEVPESHLNAGEKKPRKEKDTDNRDRDLRGRKEERQQITSLENEKRNFDLRGKLNLSDKIAPEKGNISGLVETGTLITTKCQNVMHHKESLDSLQKEVPESHLNAGEKKPRKEKDRDLRGRKEERQQITSLENEKRNFDLRGKLNLSDKIAPEKGNISGLVEIGTLITTKCQNVMHHKESLDSSLQKEVPESHLNAGEKKPRKEKDTDNRDRDLRGRKEERQQITSLENEKRNFDLRGKLNLSDKIAPEKGNISGLVETGTLITTKCQNVMHHKESLDSSLQKEVPESHLNAGEKKPRKEKDTDNRDRDLRGRKEERQQITSLENEKRNFDLRGKLNLSDKIAPEKGNISGLVETGTLITTKCQNVMHHKESLDSSLQKEVPESHLNAGEKKPRKEKDTDNWDLRGGKEERRQITSLENEKRNFDLRGKLNLSDKIAPEKGNITGLVEISTLITTKCQNVMHHKESLDSSLQKEVSESHLNAGEKKPRKEKDTDNRDGDLKGRKEERQQVTSLENEIRNFDLGGKLNQSSSNHGKNEGDQESKGTKSDGNHETGNKIYFNSSGYEKSSSTRGKTQLRDQPHPKDKLKNKHEKSPQKRDSKGYERCRETEYRRSATGKEDNQPRRSKRTIPFPKEETSHKSVKCDLNDSRNRNDLGRKEKRTSDYNKDLRSTYNKESRCFSKNEMSTSKNGKQTRDDKSTKSDRRHDEKRRSRDDRDASRRERKGPTEKERLISQSPNKKRNKVDSCSAEQESPSTLSNGKTNAEKKPPCEQDTKLSFMETLNLTLSPAKKKSQCEVEHGSKNVSESNVECTIVAAEDVVSSEVFDCLENAGEKKTLSNLRATKEIDSTTITETQELQVGGVHIEEPLSLCESIRTVDPITCLQELPPALILKHINATPIKKVPPEVFLADDLISLSSDEMETHSCVDGSDIGELESFIEIDKCSGSESPNESNPDKDIVQTEICQDQAMLAEQIPDPAAGTTSNLEPNTNENLKDADTSHQCMSLSKELNKENCQPANKADTDSGNDWLVISSDEVEEGEIISDNEDAFKSEKTLESSEKNNSAEEVNIIHSQVTCTREMSSLTDANGVVSKTPPASKEKAKIRTKTKLIPLPNSTSRKQKPCLEGIVQIVKPSTVLDVLLMSRVIRKHIRTKYMKFKMQVSVRQFHSVIEHGTLYFLELMKTIDWSTLCSSPDRVKKCACKYIESKMKRVKKNGIVDRIFEQRLEDMKKKLWKFVDEQLDCLFDKLKAMLTRLCDKVKQQRDDSTNLLTSETTANPKVFSVLVNDPHKTSKNKKKNLSQLSKKMLRHGTCLRQEQHELPYGSKGYATKHPNVSNKLTHPKKGGAVSPVSDTRPAIALGKNVNANHAAKHSHISNKSLSLKPDRSIQNTSELSFSLLSDDHMGELFKSLLHHSDHLVPNNILDEDIFICISPEKNNSLQKSENVNLSTELTTPTQSFASWPPVFPSQSKTFSRFDHFLHPDVLDESCMLEIPNSASSVKNIPSSEERTKSFTSILLEDLAVSLTVPSPLKSDSHLSFLREASAPETVLGEILDPLCIEDALLEEDATEQDIHLTLDSENSSSCSLPDTNDTPSTFQCHPSEPMQAVVMEKSNDHFIVKIRRAVSNSPNAECSSTEDASIATTHLAQPEVKTLSNVSCNSNEGESGSDLLGEGVGCQSEMYMRGNGGNKTSEEILGQPSFSNETRSVNALEAVTKLLEGLNASCTTTATDVNTSCDTVKHSTGSVKEVDVCSGNTNVDPLGEEASNLCIAEDTGPTVVKKRKNVAKEESLPKRQKGSSHQDSETERSKSRRIDKTDANTSLDAEKCSGKHNRSSSDDLTCMSSPSNLSAKNIIKKKGEVIVSWTREEDRTILLECQKLGPNEKTFEFLSLKMNKLPFQIEERFRQLLKLFKKSKHAKS
ncbi:CASP8-associated protein 2 [Spea bombifrons]|uniref:CASP8-associated protein 2 n=1 Tax=Spea bombifrons TaxID=233779 RepID=UPI002349F31C|nr:CASP8-associated protein 2 [Spea bombifrons]XP_053317176.1 CASP8-associated protein 2 [Spea bombifrons]